MHLIDSQVRLSWIGLTFWVTGSGLIGDLVAENQDYPYIERVEIAVARLVHGNVVVSILNGSAYRQTNVAMV